MTRLAAAPQEAAEIIEDPRAAVFRSGAAREVFHSVCQRDQIWRPCLWDVQEIHEEARDVFYATLDRAFVPPGTPYGHLLLLLGEAGSGKTHLMRAIRTHVHGNRLGYCAYMQMTTATENYGRYILSNVIDSLDDVYFEGEIAHSGLTVLSNALLEDSGLVPAETIERLRTGEMTESGLAHLTVGLADRFLADRRFEKLDPDILRALCCLQRDDPPLKSRVLKFLRCEPLHDFDQRYLPGLTARVHDHHPLETVGHLARTMRAAHGRSFVLLIDQLEDMANFDVERDAAAVRFRRAIQTISALAGEVPSSVFVVSCLEDFYEDLQKLLTGPARDRLEQDPPPVRLTATRTEEEVVKLVSVRLHELYHAAGIRSDDPIYPFPAGFLAQLAGLRTRDVLERCQRFRDGHRQESPAPLAVAAESTALALAWNDFRTTVTVDVPESEEEQARVLAGAIAACGLDLPADPGLSVDLDGRQLAVAARGPARPMTSGLLIAVCNKRAQGGGLKKQIDALREAAGKRTPVIVRSTEFPDPKSQTGKLLEDFLKAGGRRAVVEDSHWRQMLAFEKFQRQHARHVQYRAWREAERPLAALKPLIDILQFDPLAPITPPDARSERAAPQTVQRSPGTPKPALGAEASSAAAAGPAFLIVGAADDDRHSPVTLEIQECSRPAAFVGDPESGVMSIPLNLIEQLALVGVPAVLVDRRGDMCGYATDRWWSSAADSPDMAWRRGRLREMLDVTVYTPGAPHGNPLAIPLVPADMPQLPTPEREMAARTAAAALAGLMDFTQSSRDQKLLDVLYRAILIQSQTPNAVVTVETLVEFIGRVDPALTSAIGEIDRKSLGKLAADLQALAVIRSTLLAADGPQLDVGALLGCTGSSKFGSSQPGPSRPGKTRLSIISTKFLGENAAVEFWVAQFLAAVERWVGAHPADRLQGVLFLDEADMYLPAARQPATRLPMECLLKRARSAGLGIFLATHSPGDLDDKCRDDVSSWFLGRIRQETALKKLKPLFPAQDDRVSRLAGQEKDQFTLIRDGQLQSLRADRSALELRPLTEDEILNLAAISRGREQVGLSA